MPIPGATDSSPCTMLAWDSDFFGFPIARVAPAKLNADTIRAIDAWAARESPRCIYYFAAADDYPSLRSATAAGFELADVRLTVGRSLSGSKSPTISRDPGIEIRDAREEDLAALIPIARASHDAARFLTDPRFPRERSLDLYETWLVRSVRREIADGVLVAGAVGEAVGYMTYTYSGGEAHLCLLGVSHAVRGRGLGRALVEATMVRLAELGAASVSLVTQAGSIVAMRLYESLGFQVERIDLCFHRWSREHGGTAP